MVIRSGAKVERLGKTKRDAERGEMEKRGTRDITNMSNREGNGKMKYEWGFGFLSKLKSGF